MNQRYDNLLDTWSKDGGPFLKGAASGALRTRKHEDLNAPIEEGAISTTLVHLANISYRVGRTLHFDAASYKVTGDAEANSLFRREYRKPFVVPEKV